jgi:hypothetical protein
MATVCLLKARSQQMQQCLLEHLLVAAALDHPHIGVARPSLVDAAMLATEAGVAAQLAYPTIGSPSMLLGSCWSVPTRWPSSASWGTCSTTLPPTRRRARWSG